MTKDFTLEVYSYYLDAIVSNYANILTFADYFKSQVKPESFILIRHDVDRKPGNSLKMALLENSKGIRSTYYFRSVKSTFKPDIIKTIGSLGHEIGYHYENLSYCKGQEHLAMEDFKNKLGKYKELIPINTISMHGSPLSKYNNKALWEKEENHKLLNKLGILGEVYLDIDYRDIAYIGDTGRTWLRTGSNIRDYVNSNIRIQINNFYELLEAFRSKKYSKVCFQVHPERWSDNIFDYNIQHIKDLSVNIIKKFILLVRS